MNFVACIPYSIVKLTNEKYSHNFVLESIFGKSFENILEVLSDSTLFKMFVSTIRMKAKASIMSIFAIAQNMMYY